MENKQRNPHHYVLLVTICIFMLLIGVVYSLKGLMNDTVSFGSMPATSTTQTVTSATKELQIFRDTQSGVTFVYPEILALVDAPIRDTLYDFDTIAYFKFHEFFATGTNLSNDSYIEIKNTNDERYSCVSVHSEEDVGKVKSIIKIVGQYNWQRTEKRDAGAGNFFEELSYETNEVPYCLTVYMYLHSTNIDNYDPGTINEFDRIKIEDAIQTILGTLRVEHQ